MTDPTAIQPSELDQLPDRDPEETAEWRASLDAVTKAAGPHRAAYLMRRTLERAEGNGLALPKLLETDYVNTIPTAAEPAVDGDEAMEARITAWNRWNAAAMVTRGAKHGVGGHIATFASAAWLYETGFNHFFKGKEGDGSGDQLYIQGHASPGIYARAFLDGRLSETHLDNFRQEAGGKGLPSYPHPRRLPWLWEFPTVSMGLGPLSAIYQARFNRYLTSRGIKDVSQSHVWAFLGDGEMDEPESTAALALASREGLDNLTFVINCNLQRLDGPVRANFKIVQELEAQFRGSRLERRQVAVGQRLGRAVPARHHGRARTPPARGTGRAGADVPDPRRRLHPPGLLRLRPGARRDGEAAQRRQDPGVLPPVPRWSRGAQGVRRVQGRGRAQGRPDRHPRPDGQGLHARPGLRVQERQPPDEEAVDGRVQADA